MAQYSILVDVEFETQQIKKKLQEASKGAVINVDDSSLKEAVKNAEDLGLSFQAANAILRTTNEIIEAMVEQVYELDSAMTEFKKVSDLRGSGLEEYQKQLSDIGKTVARTGKPKSHARSNGMGNQC